MVSRSISKVLVVVAASLGLSACSTYDGYGYGGGYYGGGYGLADSPYYGWYNDFYYPGTGYYVYDRGGRSHAWTRDQRRYWMSRARNRADRRPNWQGYRGDGQVDRPQLRPSPPANRDVWRNRQMNREQFRGQQRQMRRQNHGQNPGRNHGQNPGTPSS